MQVFSVLHAFYQMRFDLPDFQNTQCVQDGYEYVTERNNSNVGLHEIQHHEN